MATAGAVPRASGSRCSFLLNISFLPRGQQSQGCDRGKTPGSWASYFSLIARVLGHLVRQEDAEAKRSEVRRAPRPEPGHAPVRGGCPPPEQGTERRPLQTGPSAPRSCRDTVGLPCAVLTMPRGRRQGGGCSATSGSRTGPGTGVANHRPSSEGGPRCGACCRHTADLKPMALSTGCASNPRFRGSVGDLSALGRGQWPCELA